MPHSAAISSCIISADAASLNRRDLEEHLDQFDHNNQVRLLMGAILPAQAHQTALKLRQLLAAAGPGGAGERGRAGDADVFDTGAADTGAGGDRQ